MRKFLKIISLILVLTLVSIPLISCSARPLAHTGIAKKVVGTVGTHNVYYEELYFLANGYKKVAKSEHGNDKKAMSDAIWNYVKENVIQNYAILDLCASNGLNYNAIKLSSRIEQSIDATIKSQFNGNRSDYLASQLEAGITDHYYRFCLGVDALYSDLATKYQTEGKVPNTDAKLKDYIKENFIHTWHIAIYVDKGDDYEAEKARAEEAKKLLDGGRGMKDLIGSTYNENFFTESLKGDTYGYYFPRGIMDKAYEDAAWELGIGEHTEVIASHGKSPRGTYVDCFYVIEKLPVKDAEIDSNFEYLSDMVKDSIITQELETYRKKLSFKPNEYALSLDITDLEAPKNGADYQLILAITLSVVGVGLTVASIFVFRSVRAKKFHKKHSKKR